MGVTEGVIIQRLHTLALVASSCMSQMQMRDASDYLFASLGFFRLSWVCPGPVSVLGHGRKREIGRMGPVLTQWLWHCVALIARPFPGGSLLASQKFLQNLTARGATRRLSLLVQSWHRFLIFPCVFECLSVMLYR